MVSDNLVFASLPKEYKTFIVNYNMQPDKWDIEKLITMCAQEEERIKSSQGESAHFMKDNKKRTSIRMSNLQGKPLKMTTIQRTTMLKLRRISVNGARSMDTTRGIVQTS